MLKWKLTALWACANKIYQKWTIFVLNESWSRDQVMQRAYYACSVCYVYANLYVNLREGINWYKSLPKHKTIIKDLENIIQGFKTVSGLGL